MIRKLSGSAEDTDSNEPLDAEPPPYSSHGEKSGFTSAKYDVTRHSDTLDRRKIERSIDLTSFSPDGPTQVTEDRQGTAKKQLLIAPNQPNADRMPGNRSWRRSQTRNPWSCSWVTISATFTAVVLFISIFHAFLTRQLDSKGCDMCWSKPIYFKFSDFDTEHTRFASKYHLYLHREGGFDEDPTVSGCKSNCDALQLIMVRSKGYLSSSYPEMLEATSRQGALPSRRPSIIIQPYSRTSKH